MTEPRDLPRGTTAVGAVLTLNVVIGVEAYFIAFLFAYGFRDRVTASQHVFFLIEVAVIAMISALISAVIIRPRLGMPLRKAFALALSAGATLHLVVLGIGSIISATHKADNSVSASFSTTTDVLVAIGLFAPAFATAWLTWHWWPRRQIAHAS